MFKKIQGMFLCYSTANWHIAARCVRSQDYKLALERPAGHFQIKWGQAYVVGKISPPCLNRINVSAKSKWGQIPTVPISSTGPGPQKGQRRLVFGHKNTYAAKVGP